MKEIIIAKGKIEVERMRWSCPYCDAKNVFNPLVGGFRRKEGFATLQSIDSALESLNGQEVEIVLRRKEGK